MILGCVTACHAKKYACASAGIKNSDQPKKKSKTRKWNGQPIATKKSPLHWLANRKIVQLPKFMCKIDKNAPIFLISTEKFWAVAAHVMEVHAKITKIQRTQKVVTAETNKSMPKVENFKIMHAKITDPAQEASTCASGNQK